MGSRNRNKQNQKPSQTTQQSNQSAEQKSSIAILIAIIGGIALIIGAIINYIGNIRAASIPVEAAQTADTLHTSIAMTAQTPLRGATEITPTPLRLPVILDEFNTNQGFQSTSNQLQISQGKIFWNVSRKAGDQYLYVPIESFNGDMRLTAVGQVNKPPSGNCAIGVGVGDKPGSGVAINFGYYGTGCSQQGTVITASGVTLDMQENPQCIFVGNWLWIQPNTPARAELTTSVSSTNPAELSVEGVGTAKGDVNYSGDYGLLWIGASGNNDWPSCSGEIDSVKVEWLQ